MNLPLISVIVPFYKAEKTILNCLESVAAQTYPSIELVILNDGSKGILSESDHFSCAEDEIYGIIEKFSKKHASRKEFCVRYIEHEKNEGTFQARRTALENSSGAYCCFLDADDALTEQSLSLLYEAAMSCDADIVHGKAEIIHDENLPENRRLSVLKKIELIHEGVLEGERIADDFLCNRGHSFFLCGKLFRSEALKSAYALLPNFYCTTGEDFLLYYFICMNAKRYVGINEKVYRYDIDTGITSETLISSLDRWKRVCSVASAFTVLYSVFKESPPEDRHRAAVQKVCISYLANNIKQLRACVVPELYDKAYSTLCEYWGSSFVKRVESMLADYKGESVDT
ncbi:glycosyltransferase family 2 protein [Treponema parvum]|uniref:Glycosyltransferase family 2 protein n=1 Tax=Treponema parvum TaxID=138851 RepID=A0A975IEF4_9SPIR|nr:glycosyltransferase family 2 protein [Treponema parvum]QTQ13229.1 glycosyltransferase family 2 protein [Treponema parvum]